MIEYPIPIVTHYADRGAGQRHMNGTLWVTCVQLTGVDLILLFDGVTETGQRYGQADICVEQVLGTEGDAAELPQLVT